MHYAHIPIAVQISNVNSHPVILGRSGLWELILLTIGIVFTIYGGGGALNTHRWRARARIAHGVVVDNLPQPRGRRTGWHPLVEFEADGLRVLAELPGSASQPTLPLGSAIDVLYDPLDPQHHGVASAGNPPAKWLIVGLVIVMLAVII